jgi:hypothetical protein
MCPDVIVIERIRVQDSTQVLLAEYYEVLNALAADRANEPLGAAQAAQSRLRGRKLQGLMVPAVRIELTTSPLSRDRQITKSMT